MKVSELQVNQNIGQIKQGHHQPNVSPVKKSQQDSSFSSILTQKFGEIRGLKFSSHALKRLNDRKIPITPSELARLNNGVQQAETKGAINSLVLVDNNAYIVSIKNKTVVTAVPQAKTQGNVFTNIDSVAIV